MKSATAAGAAAVLTPIVDYIASLCGVSLPAEVLSSIVVLLIGLGHYAGQYVPQAREQAPAAAPAPAAQGGFSSVAMLLVTAGVALALVACGTPTGGQVQQIRMACAADAGLRPSIDVMLAVPNFATPEEMAAIVAARAVIDPICKNPEAPFAGGDPYMAVTQATATVAGIMVQMQARK